MPQISQMPQIQGRVYVSHRLQGNATNRIILTQRREGAEQAFSSELVMEMAWVFNGARSQFPSGVFSSREMAEEWIARHGLSGCLTQYPVDEGAYDWSVREGLFKPKRADQESPEFIARFSGGATHFHYEEGQCAS